LRRLDDRPIVLVGGVSVVDVTGESTTNTWAPIGDGEYLGLPSSTRFPIYTRGNAGEVFPEVQYPLSFTMSWEMSQAAFRRSVLFSGIIHERDVAGEMTEAMSTFGGYAYLNVSTMRLAAVRVPGMSPTTVDQQYLGSSTAPPYVAMPGDKSFRGSLAAVRYAFRTLAIKALPHIDADRERVAAWKSTLPNVATASDAELLGAMRAAQPPHRVVAGRCSGERVGAAVRTQPRRCVDAVTSARRHR
jgi:hypothetical protein